MSVFVTAVDESEIGAIVKVLPLGLSMVAVSQLAEAVIV
jgi:hypothetical protein